MRASAPTTIKKRQYRSFQNACGFTPLPGSHSDVTSEWKEWRINAKRSDRREGCKSRTMVWCADKPVVTGFTIVELMVIVGVVAVIGGIMFANYEQGRKSRDVQIGKDSTVSALRQMQNNILAGEPYSLTTSARAYGLKLSATSSTYETFVEEAGTVVYRRLELLNFPSGVLPSNIQVTQGASVQSATNVEIRFFPPFGEVRTTARSGATVLFTEEKNIIANFDIIYQGSSFRRSVTVDGISGRID